jgi:hypothetical protein
MFSEKTHFEVLLLFNQNLYKFFEELNKNVQAILGVSESKLRNRNTIQRFLLEQGGAKTLGDLFKSASVSDEDNPENNLLKILKGTKKYGLFGDNLEQVYDDIASLDLNKLKTVTNAIRSVAYSANDVTSTINGAGNQGSSGTPPESGDSPAPPSEGGQSGSGDESPSDGDDPVKDKLLSMSAEEFNAYIKRIQRQRNRIRRSN